MAERVLTLRELNRTLLARLPRIVRNELENEGKALAAFHLRTGSGWKPDPSGTGSGVRL